TADNRIHFEIPNYDKTKPLVIDPTLIYSTYLGGSGADFGFAIAVDSSGNAYVTGATHSPDFPVANAFQSTNPQGVCTSSPESPPIPCGVAVVTKLNAAGTALVYSTYLGGSGGSSIAVDSNGNGYVTGATTACDFPTTPGAYEPASPLACGGGDGTIPDGNPMAFVAKFTSAGAVAYSTYFDGNQGGATGNGIA